MDYKSDKKARTFCSRSFIYWAMRNFNQINFGICGKTIQSAECNVIMPIFQLADVTSYYNISYTRVTKMLTVFNDGYPIMTKSMLERAYSMYTGVFFDRYIKGLWVVAEGLIYKIFADNPENFLLKDNSKLKNLMKINIGVDFGGNKSAHIFVATGVTENYKDIIALMSKRYDAKNITPQHYISLKNMV